MRMTSSVCRHWNGSGRDPDFSGECRYCRGRGRMTKDDRIAEYIAAGLLIAVLILLALLPH